MPRFEKWLTNVSADTPADEAARRALGPRLEAVRHYLDQATSGNHEVEAVHQLRIWTRRAAAALRFFGPAIRGRRRRWLKKTLRKLRRSAGAVRDCDVHLQRLESTGRSSHRRLKARLRQQRREARQTLKRLRRRLNEEGRLRHRTLGLLDSIAWPGRHSSAPPPLADWSRQQLEPLAARFFELADADLSDMQTVHALRIAGKRLRYALELTPTFLDKRAHGDFYRRLSAIQDRLGEICDHLASVAQLSQWRKAGTKKSTRRKLKALLRTEQANLEKLHAGLLRWWSPARRQRLAERWERAIGR